ncbi:MAG: hypothetical protein Q9M40_02425 [Sulfurimonas sp.]|nr:hypothetical protein [Sulfurimonas sp.]
MKIIVSGVGVDNARVATQTLIDAYDISDEDIYLNIGICAASKQFCIGELLSIGSICYHKKITHLKDSLLSLLTLDEQSSIESAPIVDMEAYGFYDAIIHSPAIKNFYIFKVVSDHFEPYMVTKDLTKKLIFNQIDAINNSIKLI